MLKSKYKPYRPNRLTLASGVDEMVRQEMIDKLNRFNIFQDREGRELQASPYDAVKRAYSLHLIVRGEQPGGEPE